MEKHANLINLIICIALALLIGMFIGRRAHAHKTHQIVTQTDITSSSS